MQLKRVMLLLGLLGAAFAGLGYRLVDLQVVRHDELSVKAEANTQHEYWLAPRRGDILDVNGNLLATSVRGAVPAPRQGPVVATPVTQMRRLRRASYGS